MSATDRRPVHREGSSAGSGRPARRPSSGRADEVRDVIAHLDVLAAHLRSRGWTTYINTPAGRLAFLFMQDPHHRAECGEIIALPDSATGDWWYWFSWAQRIAPVHPPAAAADAIIAACQRPADGSPVPQVTAANGHAPGRARSRTVPPRPSAPLARA
jgi:hypothetical protein